MLPRPDEDTAVAFADWLECWLLFQSDDEPVSFADVREGLENLSVDYPDEKLEWIVRSVRRRQSTIRNPYPVRVASNRFELSGKWQDFVAYSFLLLVSLGQHYPALRFGNGRANLPGELFEFLSLAALRSYLGGEALRFGARRREPLPSGFIEALDFVCRKTRTRLIDDTALGKEKDDGLDLVAWRPFTDGRQGHIVVLGQCAIQANWRPKDGDLELEVWRNRVRWNTPPLRSFFVPFDIDVREEEWRKRLDQCGLVFDRVRIGSLLDSGAVKALVEGDPRLMGWCQERAAGLPLFD